MLRSCFYCNLSYIYMRITPPLPCPDPRHLSPDAEKAPSDGVPPHASLLASH